MKALEEIGILKAVNFTIQSILLAVYQLLIFPPLRFLFLSIMGAEIGKDTTIMNVKFINFHRTGFKGLKIGNECFIGDETLIDLYDQVSLKDQVTLGQRVLVLTHTNVGYKNHPLQKFFPKNSKPVTFKNGCFIGAGSIILPGITIGEESFVAAGSVVTENVPKKTLVAGIPAKVVRKI